MSRRRAALVLALGAAALGTAGLLSPWVYDRTRFEVLAFRLERGEGSAVEGLAEARYAPRLLERYRSTRNEALAGPLVELAREGKLGPRERRELFDLRFAATFTEQAPPALPALPAATAAREALVAARVNRSVWELVHAGRWLPATYRIEVPAEGGVFQYLEHFIAGEGTEARLVHLRSSSVLCPPGARTVGERFRVETEDLTGVPDVLGPYLAPPRKAASAGGEEAVELRFAFVGPWRQFVPRLRLFERSVAYSLHLERPGQEPLHLADVAVAADAAAGRWFAEDAIARAPVPDMERGAHRVEVRVPRGAARLEPFAKLRVLFRPAPAFAARCGFEAPASGSPPFERECYLPPFER
ncbi:MAG: hypothetical protein HY721_08330 [Planctomycetes bacterium]|nr:hypothetical protein [Planctomycetota bacterium]